MGTLARAFNMMGEAVLFRQEELERQAAVIERMSVTDELTGLYNRRGFLILAAQHEHLALRGKNAFAIMFADLNGLKKINDSLGHDVGDRAIRKTAIALKACVRAADIVARLGGDEFVMPLHDATPTTVDLVKERIRRRLTEHEIPDDRVGALSVSIGTAFHTWEHQSSVAELLAEADRRMYAEKQLRGGQPLLALGDV